jgi:hypothetical protein
MRRYRRRIQALAAVLSLVVLSALASACQTSTSAAPELVAGDCVSVANLGEDDAAPVRRVPCAPPGTTPFNSAEFSVYRIVVAITVDVPVISRTGADNLAQLYCRHPEVVAGSSIYVFPTEASFAEGFRQFLCLVR